MSKSLRLPKRHLTVVNRQAHQVGHRVLAVGRICVADCANCANYRQVTIRRNGELVTVACPVCSLSAASAVAVAR